MATTYPVYDVARSDFTRDCQPVGNASNEAEALVVLAKHFDGTGADAPTKVELADKDVGQDHLWAYWLA